MLSRESRLTMTISDFTVLYTSLLTYPIWFPTNMTNILNLSAPVYPTNGSFRFVDSSDLIGVEYAGSVSGW
jgi:hypothetical protein